MPSDDSVNVSQDPQGSTNDDNAQTGVGWTVALYCNNSIGGFCRVSATTLKLCLSPYSTV